MGMVEHLRTLRPKHPDLVDRLIAVWGTRELGALINSLLRESTAGIRKLDDRVIGSLIRLKADHDSEYPDLVVDGMPDIPDELITDDNFQTVNRAFPHVARRLTLSWGQKAFSAYVNGLINDTRGGKRQGFPKRIALALFQLMQKHDRIYPEHEIKIIDIWELNNER